MKKNITNLWFEWFYKSWKNYNPGNLIENNLTPSQIAENFVGKNQNQLIEFSKKFDENNYDALIEFMKLSESELLVLKYFLKLIKLNKSK
tara:strand:- start:2455 stop:2724 length:270 start_codon:yes stop_codon:yes gene_type:complete